MLPKTNPGDTGTASTATSAPSPQFEEPAQTTATAAAPVSAPTAASAPTVSAPAPIAVQQTGAVSVVGGFKKPFALMQDVLRVDFDTLIQIQAVQGNYVEKSQNLVLGDEIILKIMSWQKNYVISPGEDTEEAKKQVRYSNDGVNLTTGTATTADYIKELIGAGYLKASMKERTVLVGALVDPGRKAPGNLKNELVQIDLPPSSRKMFDRYTIGTAYKISQGLMTEEVASLVKMTTRIDKQGVNQFTVALFETHIPQAAAA